jgi:hypothetical protein
MDKFDINQSIVNLEYFIYQKSNKNKNFIQFNNLSEDKNKSIIEFNLSYNNDIINKNINNKLIETESCEEYLESFASSIQQLHFQDLSRYWKPEGMEVSNPSRNPLNKNDNIRSNTKDEVFRKLQLRQNLSVLMYSAADKEAYEIFCNIHPPKLNDESMESPLPEQALQRIPEGLAPEVETLNTAEPIGSALAGACERLQGFSEYPLLKLNYIENYDDNFCKQETPQRPRSDGIIRSDVSTSGQALQSSALAVACEGLQNNLEEKNIQYNFKYNTSDITNLFMQIDKSVIIVQIIDNKITFIEKKGYQSRNQSVIDLLLETTNYYKLPNIQFIIFTDDFLEQKELIQDYLFTFCKNNLYNTILFPNFSFNHWKEANIDYFSEVYINLVNNRINWNEKEDIIFWSGSNTNIIRKKVYNGSYIYNNLYQGEKCKYLINLANNYNDFKNKNKYYSLNDHCKYKYLLNMNGHSYGGRLNYLFLTRSCIIVLKNANINNQWEEFFYKNFIPNIDYIEILYNDNELEIEIINKINNSISNSNCEEIANNCFIKAVNLFKLDKIYSYINILLKDISLNTVISNYIQKSIFYTTDLNIFLKNRIFAENNKFSFKFKGTNFEIKINNYENNYILISLGIEKSIISFNNIFIFNKHVPNIMNNIRENFYEIFIINNEINITVNNRINLIKERFYCEQIFNILSIEIKTNGSEGFWIT